MELLSVKLVVLVLMGAVRILCGMLPLAIVKIIKRRWSKSADRRLKKCISILVFFGGGVMLATCFLHMMPEVQESFSEALPDVHIPIPQIIFVAGFFLVYMIEDIVHALIHKRKTAKRQKKNAQKEHHHAINRNVEKGGIVALPYNNNDSPAVPPIAVIGGVGGKNGEYLCYANSYPTDNDEENNPCRGKPQQQYLPSNPIDSRKTKELFDKNVVRKCDDIPGLPKNHSISTTNMIIQSRDQDGNNKKRTGNGGLSNGLIVGTEKFSYIDPEWFRDTVIANSEANLLGKSTSSIMDKSSVVGVVDEQGKTLHDLHLNKSQNINTISDDSNSSSSSSGSTSCSRKNLQKSSSGKRSSSHAHHHHEDDEQDDDHDFHNEHSHIPVAFIDGEDELDQTIGAEIRNLLIVIAISFHGIFEGLAIGLQNSTQDVWYMFFAVSLHECTILFCIGVELISNKTKVMRMVLYVLIVSLVSPVGIAVGIIITEKTFGATGIHALVVGSLQGLAAGSLLYVTFFEIFQEEGRKLHRKYIHILVAIVGFVMMGALEFLGGHSHGGSSSHTHGGNNSHSHKGSEDHHHDHDHGHHNESDEDHQHHHHNHQHDDHHFHDH